MRLKGPRKVPIIGAIVSRATPILAALLAACAFDPAPPGTAGPADANALHDAGRLGGDAGSVDGGVQPDGSAETCGDGALDPGEICDDANVDAMDGCSPACLVEPGWYCRPAILPSRCDRLPTVDLADAVAQEGTVGLVEATLSATVSHPIVLTWSTHDDTAAAPADYDAIVDQVVAVAPGTRSVLLPVDVLDDGVPEAPETLGVAIVAAEGATLGDVVAELTIEDRLALVDRGLLLRYFLDDADGGSPDAVVDSGPAPAFDLQASRSTNGPSFVETLAGRSLAWDAAGSRGGYVANVSDKVRLAIDGGSRLTVEAVVRAEAVANDSRVFHIGEQTYTACGLLLNDQVITLGRNGDFGIAWPIRLAELASSRVVTIVIDTTLPDDGSRARFYLDGVDQGDAMQPPFPGATFIISSFHGFVIGNRPANDRSLSGEIGYLAIYTEPLTSQEVRQNASILAVKHDSP